MKFCWVTINVRDLDRSVAFYRDVAGLSVNRRYSPKPGTEIAFLGSPETATEVELIRNEKNDDCAYGKDISIGFEVGSVDETLKSFAERGVAIHSGPFSPNPAVKFFYVLDPDGLRVQFVQKG